MHEVIASLIARFIHGGYDDPHGLRGWAGTHAALPIVFDMGGFYAVQSSGEVISAAWEHLQDVRIESEPRIRNGMLFQAAMRFPELLPLVPDRSAESRDCPHCSGTGHVVGFPPEIDNLVCYCGGLGWIPSDDIAFASG